VKCIYCGSPVDPRPDGDHVIPAVLGEFKGGMIFKRICPTCNHAIGKVEEQLLRCGPEAHLRQMIIPSTRRTRYRKKSTHVGASGLPPPKFLLKNRYFEQLLRKDIEGVKPVDQVTLIDQEGKAHHLPIKPPTTSQSLKQMVKRLKLGPIKKIFLFSDSGNLETYEKIASEAFPGGTFQEIEDLPKSGQKVLVRVEFTVTTAYFRAIAKVAFHYYLCCSQRVNGTETVFKPVRDFIRNGVGNYRRFFTASSLLEPLRDLDVEDDEDWGHLLFFDESQDIAFAVVRFFISSSKKGLRHALILGKLPSKLALPRQHYSGFSHYRYFKRTTRARYDGEVVPIDPGVMPTFWQWVQE